MTKMPEPATYIEHDGVRENLYTADQLKQYGRDLLEEAAKKAMKIEGMRHGLEIADYIRAMKEQIK